MYITYNSHANVLCNAVSYDRTIQVTSVGILITLYT